ncbi:MAG: two-component regulator propeller domain-containing protein [Chthoniobacteraceae bacterium]
MAKTRNYGLLILLLLLAPVCHASETATAKLVPALGWDVARQGGFPVSLASDAAGNVWVGTEGNGVWKYDPVKKMWTQFTTKDGLGDNCVYALAVDQQGCVWAGHLNHGVSVYNGDKWSNYGLVDGPLGDRVFAIAVCPKDGDVWIASDMGLARYSEKRADWDYYTRASGLPSDQIQCIAFDKNGRIYAGTQCDGIAFADADDDYAKWHCVTALPTIAPTPIGDGLPSNLINGMMPLTGFPAIKDGLTADPMLALTPFGMAESDDGTRWEFTRGKDWKDHTPGALQRMGNPELRVEDWITTSTIIVGDVWMGYRKLGVELVGLLSLNAVKIRADVEGPTAGHLMIRAILALPDEPPLFAGYDNKSGGLLTLDNAPPFKPVASGSGAAIPNLPAAAAVPAPDDAKPLTAVLAKMTEKLQPGEAYYLADDWRTEGDWVGRYGSSYVNLCGMGDNADQEYFLQSDYDISLQLGPHHDAADVNPVRYHDNESSDDLRSPYDPTLGHRRDAEDNDYSYDTVNYPESYDGPGLWVRATVPDGVHCLSLYFLNNDAHSGINNKYRDYDVQVLADTGDDAKTQAERPLARTRVTDFWGGVYKQFLLCGPASYVVRIGRNRSFVTKLQGIFMDRVTGDEADTPGTLPGFDTAPYQPPDEPYNYQPSPLTDAAVTLWSKLDDTLDIRGAIPLQMPLRIWCYRAGIAGQTDPQILERWRWQIGIWTPDDRQKYDDAMKAARDAAK